MMDSDTLFTDGAMGSGAPGIMAGQGWMEYLKYKHLYKVSRYQN